MHKKLIGQMKFAMNRRANRPLWWKTVPYYFSRLIVNPTARRWIVVILGRCIGRNTFAGENAHALLDVLKDEGIVRLHEALSDSQCNDIVEYLSDKLIHDRHGSLEQKISDIQSGDMAFGFHTIQNVLDCPHIMEFVSSAQIVQLAAEYLGCKPTLSGIVVQWSFPVNSQSVAQQFHRDSEDWKYLRFFVYLSDVDEGCGPHVFIKGSHRDKFPLRLKFYAAEEISQQYGGESFVKVYGKRGTGIAADTCGIHKGELPTINSRLILSFTYSMFANPFFRYQPRYTRHSSTIKNYSNRLFLR